MPPRRAAPAPRRVEARTEVTKYCISISSTRASCPVLLDAQHVTRRGVCLRHRNKQYHTESESRSAQNEAAGGQLSTTIYFYGFGSVRFGSVSMIVLLFWEHTSLPHSARALPLVVLHSFAVLVGSVSNRFRPIACHSHWALVGYRFSRTHTYSRARTHIHKRRTHATSLFTRTLELGYSVQCTV